MQDSYGAPPPSSYGAPSSGGGYSGGGYSSGGGGWGRSFNNNPAAVNLNNPQQFNHVPLIGEAVSNFVYNLNANATGEDRNLNFNSSLSSVKNIDRNTIISNHRETFNENVQNNTLNFKNLQPVYVKDWRNYNSSTIRNILYPNTLTTREEKRET